MIDVRLRGYLPALLCASIACGTEEPGPDPDTAQPLPFILLAPEGLTFGDIDSSCGKKELRFCMENRATLALAVEELRVKHEEATPDFRIASIDGGISVGQLRDKKLDPGARLCFELEYAPDEPGIDAATLEVKVEGFASAFSVEVGGTTSAMSMKTDTFEAASTKVDFLFVLDNSPGMADIAPRVRTQLRQMFDQIELMYDYRVAVTTGDPQYAGALVPYTDPENQIISSGDANARDTFDAKIRIAESSSNQVHAFFSAFRAFELRTFVVRPDASLVLVWISDRDDMSDGPVELYGGFFSRLLSDRTKFIASLAFVNTGLEAPCWSADPPAELGDRYNQVGTPTIHTLDSVCSSSYASALWSLPGSFNMGFFTLSAVPKVETLRVTARSRNGDEEPATGWRYEPNVRGIVFEGQQPPIGSTLIATYEVDCG